MLPALSVLGGLAMPNTPHAPSYAAGEWGCYFPVQKIYSPRAATNLEVPLDTTAFYGGDLKDLCLQDCRVLYPDGDIGAYAALCGMSSYRGSTIEAALRLSCETVNNTQAYTLDNRLNGNKKHTYRYLYEPALVYTNAGNGTSKAISGASTLTSQYGGEITGIDVRGYLRVQTKFSQEFYFCHMSYPNWRVDCLALQTVAGRGAVLETATQQFFAIQ